jgi:hypothetical protein
MARRTGMAMLEKWATWYQIYMAQLFRRPRGFPFSSALCGNLVHSHCSRRASGDTCRAGHLVALLSARKRAHSTSFCVVWIPSPRRLGCLIGLSQIRKVQLCQCCLLCKHGICRGVLWWCYNKREYDISHAVLTAPSTVFETALMSSFALRRRS